MIHEYKPLEKREGMMLYENIVYLNRMGDFMRDSIPLKLNFIHSYSDMGFEKQPLLIWLEGGAWRNSTPYNRIPELSYFVKKGFCVADVEYSVDGNNMWPACIEDVKTAIRFLRFYADKYAIDENNIFIGGESAGAHLASLCGLMDQGQFTTREYSDMSDKVNGVVSFYCPGDTDVKVNDFIDYYDLLVRGDISENEVLKKQINPMSYLHEGVCPFIMFHGNKDELVPVECSKTLYEGLVANGCDADLYIVDGAGHADLYFSQEGIQELVVDFMRKHTK